MYSSKGDPTNWTKSYQIYNARADLPNMTPEIIIKVFLKLNFNQKRACSEFDSSWANELEEINGGVISLLTKDEINDLTQVKLVNYLKLVKSKDICVRVLGITNNDNVKEACQTIIKVPNNLLSRYIKKSLL